MSVLSRLFSLPIAHADTAIAVHSASPSGIDPNNAIHLGSNTLVTVMTLIASFLAMGFLIWYGLQYITSGGSPDKTKQARAGIVNVIIGVVVIIASYGIIRFSLTISGALSAIGNGSINYNSSSTPGASSTPTSPTPTPTLAVGQCDGYNYCVVDVGSGNLKWCYKDSAHPTANCLPDDNHSIYISNDCRVSNGDGYCYRDTGSGYRWCRDTNNCMTSDAFLSTFCVAEAEPNDPWCSGTGTSTPTPTPDAFGVPPVFN